MGVIHWNRSLIWEHCAQHILMTIDFPHGHIDSPIIWDWGPHGGKIPHRQILGPPWGPPWGPMGTPMGPHGGPNGGHFPPWARTFFLTPFWRVNTSPRKSLISVWVTVDPYFAHTTFDIYCVKGYIVMQGGSRTLPPWALWTNKTVQSLRRLCYTYI